MSQPQLDRPDWSPQFRTLLSSPLGAELLRTLREDVHDGLIGEAEAAKSSESAFGLLKQAAGVIKSIEHLQFLSVTPQGEGSRDKK